MYYSTPEDGGGEADPSHQIYNRLTHDTHNTGGQSQDTRMNSTLQGNYEMGEYSTVSNYRLSHGVTGEEVSTADQPLPQLFYAQASNNLIKKDEDKNTSGFHLQYMLKWTRKRAKRRRRVHPRHHSLTHH